MAQALGRIQAGVGMMNEISFTSEHIKSLTGLSAFAYNTSSELFRFILNNKRVLTDKLNAAYFTRCFVNGSRCNENAADTASALIVDCDSQIIDGAVMAGAVNPLYAHLVLNHLKCDHFIYTSHSNDIGLNKYRIVIPCHYTRHQLAALLDWLFARFHENDVMIANVKENTSWAQAWFMPSVHPARQDSFKTFWRVNGKESNPMPSFEFVPSECFWAERILKEAKPLLMPVTPELPKVTANLSANPIHAFNASFSVHDILIRNGYKQQGKRYLHPNSDSGSASVRILKNGAFSNSSDALNDGKAHDAFDCYRILECGGDNRTALNWNTEITKANRRAFYA